MSPVAPYPREEWTFADVLARAVDAFLLGALVVLSSVPVVSVLAAGAGADAVVASWRERRVEPVWRTFWTAFRASCPALLRVQLVLVAPVAIAAVNLLYVTADDRGLAGVPVLAVALLLLASTAGVATSAPVLARLAPELDARRLLVVSAVVVARTPVRALGRSLVLLLTALMTYLVPALLPLLITPAAAVLGLDARAALRRATAHPAPTTPSTSTTTKDA